MEKQNFNEILIRESEYYNSQSSYVSLFSRNNITTIDQLFDEHFWEFEANNVHKETRPQLTALISMLKYKYLGEPLCYAELMDNEINFNAFKEGYYRGHIPLFGKNTSDKDGNNLDIDLTSLFGAPRSYCDYILSSFLYYLKRVGDKKSEEEFSINLIDLFKWILNNKELKKVHPFVIAYLEAYEKNHKEEIDSESLSSLKNELENLLQTKNKLELQIAELKEKISLYENKDGLKV